MGLCICKKQKRYLANLNIKEMYSRNIKALRKLTEVGGNQSQWTRAEMHSKIVRETVSNKSSKIQKLLSIPCVLTKWFLSLLWASFQTPGIQNPLLEHLVIWAQVTEPQQNTQRTERPSAPSHPHCGKQGLPWSFLRSQGNWEGSLDSRQTK